MLGYLVLFASVSLLDQKNISLLWGEISVECMEVSAQTFFEHDLVDLLCMPQVLAALIEACIDGSDDQSLADIVLQDAALAAKLILAASKTSPRSLDPLEPVSSAIEQLGIPMMTGIALRSARQVVQRSFTPQELSFQYGLWFSSRVSGLFARCLAPSVNYPYIEEAQLSGLLQNLGIYALFSREGAGYVGQDVNPWSSAIQCHLEEASYKINHLQIADKLIEPWQLDSFLADSIRFLHADIAEIEQGHQLLKIARLAQHFCQSPRQLMAETEELAGRLFGLKQSEIAYLVEWSKGLYPSFGDLLNHPEKLQEDMVEAQGRLTELSFLLADQEAARARLGNGRDIKELVPIARYLYLENSPATEVIFFLLDQTHFQLTGILVAGQPRLIGELKVQMEVKSGLLASALLKGMVTDSFQSSPSLTVTDHLLTRLSKSRGISCHPLRFEGRALGVVVLGVASITDLQQLQSLQIRMFDQVISAAVLKLPVVAQDYVSEGGGLLRRISHEVNNPLTIIGNYTEILSQSLTNAENQEITKSIQKEVRRVDDIINYYLNQQEIPGFPEPSVDLNQLLLDTVDTLRDSEFKPHQIEIRFDLQKDLENVATNPALVKQILVNLLKNSAAAVCDGGMIQLVTRGGYSSDNGRHVEVIVQDNGSGISPELQENLFHPIVSSRGSFHSGAGLNIVKEIVDDLGGRVSCHSSVGCGTSFHLQVPCRIVRQIES